MSNDRYTGPSPGPRPPDGRPPRGDWADTLSWFIDIGMIFVFYPVGLALTIANAMGHNFVGNLIRRIRGYRTEDPGARRASTSDWSRTRAQARAERAAETQARTDTGRQAQKQAQKQTAADPSGGGAGQTVRAPDAGAALKTVLGWIFAAFGLLGALTLGGSLWTTLTWAAVALGGGALLLSAFTGRRKAARFKRCITVSGTRGIVNIARLSKTLGLEGAEADRMLSEMVDRGYYGTRAYIDHERGLLVIEPEQMRDVYRAEDEEKARKQEETARAADPRTVYEEYLEKIRQADIDIDDEVMSEKIRRMQSAAAAIFDEVERHPEKKPQIERFMNYYLPTTLKLLDSYARIEDQGVSGENMAKAKADIERISDTLVAGYEKQLDTLYRAEAVDIAGDVSVIESMMRRDGLAGQNDFGGKPEGQVMGGH